MRKVGYAGAVSVEQARQIIRRAKDAGLQYLGEQYGDMALVWVWENEGAQQ